MKHVFIGGMAFLIGCSLVIFVETLVACVWCCEHSSWEFAMLSTEHAGAFVVFPRGSSRCGVSVGVSGGILKAHVHRSLASSVI